MNPSLIKTVFHIFKQRIGISVEKLLRPARKFDLQWILSIFRTNRVQLFFPPGPPLTLYGFHPGISPLCSCSMRSFRPSKIVENVQSLMLAQSHINDVTPQTHTLWTLWCDISTKTNMSNRMVQRGEWCGLLCSISSDLDRPKAFLLDPFDNFVEVRTEMEIFHESIS